MLGEEEKRASIVVVGRSGCRALTDVMPPVLMLGEEKKRPARAMQLLVKSTGMRDCEEGLNSDVGGREGGPAVVGAG